METNTKECPNDEWAVGKNNLKNPTADYKYNIF